MIVGRDGRTTSADIPVDVSSGGNDDNDGDTGDEVHSDLVDEEEVVDNTSRVQDRQSAPGFNNGDRHGRRSRSGVVCLIAKMKSSHW